MTRWGCSKLRALYRRATRATKETVEKTVAMRGKEASPRQQAGAIVAAARRTL